MKTTELHTRTLAVLEQVGGVLDSINELDPESFKQLDGDAVLRLIDAQTALREAARIITQPLFAAAIEKAKADGW